MNMLSRVSMSKAVVALAIGLAWVAPAQGQPVAAEPGDFRVCHAPPESPAVDSQGLARHGRPRDHRVRGGACGTAVNDNVYAVPQVWEGGGWVHLSGIGIGIWDTTVEATPVGYDYFTTTGILTIRTWRGSITFETVGWTGGVDMVPGNTDHGEATATAVSGTGRFRGISGVLHAATTNTFTGVPPDRPLGGALDVWFTLDGTLRY